MAANNHSSGHTFCHWISGRGPPRFLHSSTVPGPHIPSHLLPTPGVLFPWDTLTWLPAPSLRDPRGWLSTTPPSPQPQNNAGLSTLGYPGGTGGPGKRGAHQPKSPPAFSSHLDLKNGETYEELNRTTATQPKDKWWPDLYFNLTKLFEQSGYSKCRVRSLRFYACPGHQRENIKTCGGMVSCYCKSWGCVTSNDGYWKWSVTKPDLINMSFTGPLSESDWQGQPSNPGQCSDQVRLSFTKQGWTENRWIFGLSWG